jgi:hypothetical protein
VGEWRVADLAASGHEWRRLNPTRSDRTDLRALSGHAKAATPLLAEAPICRSYGWLCSWLDHPKQGVSCPCPALSPLTLVVPTSTQSPLTHLSAPFKCHRQRHNHEGLRVLGCAFEPGHGPSIFGPRCPQGAPCGK